MPIRKIRSYLDAYKIKYLVLSHSTGYTAQEVAQLTHIPGKVIAKTVIVRIDGKLAMVVVPAPLRIDFGLLKTATGARTIDLANEDDFAVSFPDCELGAMPPFGNLYGMDVLVDRILAQDPEIAFNAGNHRELIKMAYRDFERLVRPKVVTCSSAVAVWRR